MFRRMLQYSLASIRGGSAVRYVSPLTRGTVRWSHSSSSSDSTSDSDGDQMFDSVESIKLAVLDASLEYVNDYGWSEHSIAKGAEAIGYSSMSHGMVEGGGGELFLHLQKRCNEKLENNLKFQESERASQSSGVSWSGAVESALRLRLELIVPYINVWSQGLAKAALSPSLACTGANHLCNMADHVCYYAGDRSTNFQWYARRGSVIAVYKATELSLLQDKSTDYQETWQFLRRRVNELERVEGCVDGAREVCANASSFTSAALLTGLNLLGMNELSRSR